MNDNTKIPVTTGFKIWDKKHGVWTCGTGSSARVGGQFWACKGWAARAVNEDTQELVEVLVIPRTNVDKAISVLETMAATMPTGWGGLASVIDGLKPEGE